MSVAINSNYYAGYTMPVSYTHLDMTHFMGMDCVFNGEMRMERLKDMFRGKISKKSLV